jgi:hypothetical protein
LNLNKQWRKFLGKQNPDLRMGDVEALVRSFAMLEIGNKYKSPLRIFLNEFSKEAMTFTEEKIDTLCQVYNDFWECCSDLPDNAFKNDKNKFVVSLFEAVFVSVCETLLKEGVKNKKVSLDSLTALKNDEDFYNASQGSTASLSSVSTRLKRAREIISLV